jgi:hypothetical protein
MKFLKILFSFFTLHLQAEKGSIEQVEQAVTNAAYASRSNANPSSDASPALAAVAILILLCLLYASVKHKPKKRVPDSELIKK